MSSKVRMTFSDLSILMTASLAASFSMPVAAMICLRVAPPLRSMTSNMRSSPGCVSSTLRVARRSPSSFRTNLTFPLTNLPRRISPSLLILCHSRRSKFSTLW